MKLGSLCDPPTEVLALRLDHDSGEEPGERESPAEGLPSASALASAVFTVSTLGSPGMFGAHETGPGSCHPDFPATDAAAAATSSRLYPAMLGPVWAGALPPGRGAEAWTSS